MTQIFLFSKKRWWTILIGLMVFFLGVSTAAYTQMRQVYLDNAPENVVKKISFYSPSEGYVAFRDWIGFTNDSGRTFTKKYITQTNVDYGLNNVNLTFGFSIEGVKAFSQSTLIVYGDYGIVPSILYSNDGGNSFKLVFHSSYNSDIFGNSIVDMVFPQNGTIGFAVDADRILKTTNGGLTWTVVRTEQRADLSNLEPVDNNVVFAFCTQSSKVKLLKTLNGGISWTSINLPAGYMTYAYFRSALVGWISSNVDNKYSIYKTIDGGTTWTLQNDPDAVPFHSYKMKFTDDNTGYSLGYVWQRQGGQNIVYKTKNGGKLWEPLSRDNNFSYLGYVHTDLHFWNANEFWAGGGHGLLELTTNAGGNTLPVSYFKIDTSGLSLSGIVNLVNHSGTSYSYDWSLNGVPISSSYHASYTHDMFRTRDTLRLIVSNGSVSDTVVKYQNFYPPVVINSFSPTTAGSGNVVTIRGINFSSVLAVRFGNTPAASFTVVSPTTITAVVGAGASGNVSVITSTGTATRAGFTYLPAPVITSFSPMSAKAGTTVTITGSNFVNVSTVKFGGINAISFVVISPTIINAVVPSGPSGTVSVTTPGGTVTSPGYISLPSISSFTPIKGTEGTIMTITGTSLVEVTGVTIGGIAVNSFIVNSSNSITAVVGSGATGLVEVTKPGGIASHGTFNWIASPTITSYSPQVGPVGAALTIAGTGFHPVPQNNIVYFGPVKAVVTGGSSGSLTVTVPPGATYDLITVISNNLVAYSNKPFVVSFPGGGSITDRSFDSTLSIGTGSDNRPMNTHFGDLDGDQKTDLLISMQDNAGGGSVFLYRNTSTASIVSFASPVKLNNLDYKGVATGDFNGDGKLDLAIINKFSVNIFRNSSSIGNISFSRDIALTAPNEIFGVAVNDLDGDGKTDIAVINFPEIASIFRNVSEPDSIKFATRVDYTVPAGNNIVLADLDEDKKPELIIPNRWENTFYVLKNKSVKGSISFAAPLGFTGYVQSLLTAGDIDGDGKTDLSAMNEVGSQLGIMRNISTPDKIEFALPVEFAASLSPKGIAISDLDGDGKPDIAAALSNYGVAAFKNLSTPANIVMGAKSNFIAGSFGGQRIIGIADINGDGKGDPVVTTETGRSVTILLNNVVSEPFIYSFAPTIGVEDTEVVINGVNFDGTTSVTFGGIPAKSFIINSTNQITAIVGKGGNGEVAVTNSLGTARLREFLFSVPPAITSISPKSGAALSSVTITGRNFNGNADSNHVFFGGVKAKVLSATSSTLVVSVPIGSMYDFVKVTTSGLTAVSNEQFITTFAGGDTLNENSFAPKYFLSAIAGNCIADMDMDGKPDIVSASRVVRNTSISGNIAFGAIQSFILGEYPGRPITGDFDGDGKIDIAALLAVGNLSVVRNTSAPGQLSFSQRSESYVGLGTFSAPAPGIDSRDLDSDGKMDFITYHPVNGLISIVRNESKQGTIVFGKQIFCTTDGFIFVFAMDLDNDGKPDLIASHGSAQRFSFFRNTSTPGNISFAPKVPLIIHPGGAVGWYIYDADKDGKHDFIFTNATTISIYRNISTPANVAFAPVITLPFTQTLGVGTVNDYDGDGDVDISGVFALNANCIFKNTSIPGSISFVPVKNVDLADGASSSFSADMDGDGKPDIVNMGGSTSIFRNQVGGNGPVIASFSPISASLGDTVVISGIDLVNATDVRFGDTPAASYIVESSSTIKAILGSGASGNVLVKTAAGLAGKYGFVYSDKPVITSVWPLVATSAGTEITITGANLNTISSVKFGGVEATSYTVVSPSTIKAVVGNGASGMVQLSSPADTINYPGFIFALPPVIDSFTPTATTGPVTITINGANFASATSVTIGNVSHAFTIVSSTQILVSFYSGVSGKVVVTTPGGSASKDGFYMQEFPVITSFYPASGSTGTIVTINGSALGAVTSVLFGNVQAQSFQVISPTRIVAVVGNGGSGEVSVINPYRTTNPLPGFTFVPVTTPVISTVMPPVAAAGKTITITGQNFVNINMVTFGGKAARSFTVNSPTSISAVVDIGSSGDIVVGSGTGTGKFPGFVFATWPIIDSFVPKAAKPGDEITIYGSNFNIVTTANSVYFGNVKATVTSASAELIKVTVPPGSIFSPISITSGGLTGYSAAKFLPTFPGIGRLTDASFATRTDSTSYAGPNCLVLPDLDNDGFPDIAVSNTNNLTIYKNSGTNQIISFSPRYRQLDNHAPHRTNIGDFNGDGKLDILTSNTGDINAFNIYTNTSTPGKISLATRQSVQGNIGPFKATVGDFNGDGKPDFAAVGYLEQVYVFRNTSSNGATSFVKELVGIGMDYVRGIAADDMDGDGRVDIIVSGINGYVQVFKNMSSLGTLNFVATAAVRITDKCHELVTGDLDGDGKPDIVAIGGFVNVMKNSSNPEVMLLDPVISITAGNKPSSVNLSDVDGNGKVDIIVANGAENSVSILQNLSTKGSIVFDRKIDFLTNSVPSFVSVASMDGDSKPEIVLAHSLSNSVSILRNMHPATSTTTVSVCENGNTTITSDKSGTTYQWQINSGGGFVNLANDTNYSGVNTSTLKIANIAASWNNYEYRCVVNGSIFSQTSRLSISPAVIPSISIATSTANICAGAIANFSSTVTGGGVSPSFQWQINGVNMGANSNSYSNANLTNGAQIKAILISNAKCASPVSVESNIITMTVNSTVKPSVVIVTSASVICPGTNVTFTATVANEGSAPIYQWKKNGSNIGVNSNAYSSNSLQNGDVISVVLTSNSSCASPVMVESNGITMTVNSTIAPSVVIASSSSAICAGTNVTFTATSTNEGVAPVYQWKKNGANVGANNNTYSSNSLQDGDIISVVLTNNSSCASPGTVESNGITITVNSAIVPAVGIAASASTICPGTSVTFTATATNEGSAPGYQWKKNGSNVGNNNKTYSSNSIQNGDVISVVLTSNAACAAPITAVSNEIKVVVHPTPTEPGIVISGKTTVIKGQSSLLSATTANPGTTPIYEWQDSTSMHTWQAIPGAVTGELNYTPANAGDKVRCILTSNAICISKPIVTSNTLEFIVDAVTAIDPVPGSSYNIRLYPNPVKSVLTIDTLKISDSWQLLEIRSVDGRQLITQKIVGKTTVSVDVSILAAGVYLAIIKGKSGESAYWRFIKE